MFFRNAPPLCGCWCLRIVPSCRALVSAPSTRLRTSQCSSALCQIVEQLAVERTLRPCAVAADVRQRGHRLHCRADERQGAGGARDVARAGAARRAPARSAPRWRTAASSCARPSARAVAHRRTLRQPPRRQPRAAEVRWLAAAPASAAAPAPCASKSDSARDTVAKSGSRRSLAAAAPPRRSGSTPCRAARGSRPADAPAAPPRAARRCARPTRAGSSRAAPDPGDRAPGQPHRR